MSDTISRQSAIDGLRDYLVGKRCPDDGTLTCRLIENEVINKLPPANNSEIPNSSDTISRAKAIEALEKVAELYPWRVPGDRDSYSQYNEAWQDALNRADSEIEALPSAQPERTCVNCGRTVNNGGWYADGRTRCPIEEHYALPKDGFCHLWEKRNITDDDYQERRTDE